MRGDWPKMPITSVTGALYVVCSTGVLDRDLQVVARGLLVRSLVVPSTTRQNAAKCEEKYRLFAVTD